MWRLPWITSKNMNCDKDSPVLPFVSDWGSRAGELVLSAAGIGGCALIAWAEYGRTGAGALVLLLPGALFLALGIYTLAECLAKLSVTAEGVSILLLGRPLRSIPAEEIRLLARAVYYNRGDSYPMIALSTLSLEDIALLREKQLRRNPYYRSNLPFRKNGADWVQKFAAEYIRNRCHKGFGTLFGRKILWLDWDADRLKLLRQSYPHALWLDTGRNRELDAIPAEKRGKNL